MTRRAFQFLNEAAFVVVALVGEYAARAYRRVVR